MTPLLHQNLKKNLYCNNSLFSTDDLFKVLIFNLDQFINELLQNILPSKLLKNDKAKKKNRLKKFKSKFILLMKLCTCLSLTFFESEKEYLLLIVALFVND
jgi:hypothetical protein